MHFVLKQTVLFFLLLICSSLSAATYFVTPTGSANQLGTSWQVATSLAHALEVAQAGDAIWVAKGTYLPARHRESTFRLSAGVSLYGGFTGTETSLDERPVNTHTTLSGNIGDPATDSDNVKTVLTLAAGPLASTIDGFILAEGTARSFTSGYGTENAGGGLYIEGRSSTAPAHIISNCIIRNNKAHNGGAVFVQSGNTNFENCRFENNHADGKGGAIYNMAFGTRMNVRFLDCFFASNAAKYGGGLANNGENGVAVPLLSGCTFRNNVAKSNGAAAYNMTNETGECNVITEHCKFEDNESILGEDIATKGSKKSLAQRRQESTQLKVIISGGATTAEARK